MNMWNLIKPLLSFGYWFSIVGAPFNPMVENVILILMAASIVFGIAVAVYRKMQKTLDKPMRKILSRFSAMCLTAGFSGLLLYAFYFEHIQVFSMHFWWIVWFVVIGWWKYDIWKEYKKMHVDAATAKERANYEKWLPKPKH